MWLNSPESSFSILIVPDGLIEVFDREIGPEDIGHI